MMVSFKTCLPVYIFNGRKQTLVDTIGILSAPRVRGLHDKRHLLAKFRICGSENCKFTSLHAYESTHHQFINSFITVCIIQKYFQLFCTLLSSAPKKNLRCSVCDITSRHIKGYFNIFHSCSNHERYSMKTVSMYWAEISNNLEAIQCSIQILGWFPLPCIIIPTNERNQRMYIL